MGLTCFALQNNAGARGSALENEASPAKDKFMESRKDKGFSLLELAITLSIALILCGITFISMWPMLKQARLDSAYDTTLMALRVTRNLAITQSH